MIKSKLEAKVRVSGWVQCVGGLCGWPVVNRPTRRATADYKAVATLDADHAVFARHRLVNLSDCATN